LYVPDVITNNKALLFIDGGSASSTPPTTEIDPYAGGVAIASGMVLADLLNVPNQPLTFAGESSSRSEDSIIAYSWRKYLETGDPTWPVNLPMTRAAMRAMDAISDFVGSPVGGNIDLESFIVSGASKRGWTTWLASATDPRVSFAVPVVADLLNMEPSFVHHYAYYNGTFSTAVRDYVNEGILNINNFGKDNIKSLLSIVDPFTYKDRLTLPKFILNASGDEFFVPDSWQFYYDQLPGPKWIRYIGNTGHGISDPLLLLDAFTLLIGVADGYQPPSYSFTQLADGTIEVQTSGTIADAKLFQATNVNAREFRYAAVGGIFTNTNLTDQGGGVFRGNVPTPAQGWTAYFIQLSFPIPTGGLATVSSGVYFKGPPVNKQPIVITTPDTVVTEGSFAVPVVATDPDTNQTLTYSLDPGGPAGVSINPVTGIVSGFANDQLGLLAPITVVVSDNGTPVISYRDTFRITVVNAAPTAGIIAQTAAVRGEAIPFTFSATDPSPADQAAGFTYEIDWDNDNIIDVTQAGGSSINLSRIFSTSGTYAVRARVTDKDAGVSPWSELTVAVTENRTAPNPNNPSLVDLYIGGTDGTDVFAIGGGRFLNPGASASSLFYYNTASPSPTLYNFPEVTGRVIVYLQGADDAVVDLSDGGIGQLALSRWIAYGGEGDDYFVFNAFSASGELYGENGADTFFLSGSSGNHVEGGEGDDLIVATESTGNNYLDGGIGNDAILASEFNDTILGGDGNDLLLGGLTLNDQADSIDGGSGNDVILGGFGADTIYGGAGSDFLVAGAINPNEEAPEGFIEEWWSTNSYGARVNNVLNGGGLNPSPVVPGLHIIDDTSADAVYGDADQDFFWVDLAIDATPDRIGSETQVSL
jgi:PhoPQ-activated pathogenicity-related protein